MSTVTPVIFETTGSGERAYDVFSRLMKDRKIWLGGPIDDDTGNIICAQLLYLDAEDAHRPIEIYINSPGGLCSAFFAMYDIMQVIKAPVHTKVVGQACSAAAMLLLAGTNGERSALPNADIMIHQPSGGAVGTAAEIEIATRQMLKTRKKLIDIASHHTGKPASTIERDMSKDYYMTPSEALTYGIIDKIG